MTSDGFVTGDDVELLGRVAQQVKEIRPETDAHVWHSGGGIFGILMKVADGNEAFFGVVDEISAGDLMSKDGEFLGGIETGLTSDEKDRTHIAQVLLTSLDGFTIASSLRGC